MDREAKMIDYEIHQSKIKNVYIQIKEGKVIVKAPKRMSKQDIETIVKGKEAWIRKHLAKESTKQERQPLYTDSEFEQIVQITMQELVQETGLVPNKVRIKNIKYAWGSCSSNKNITINANLIKYSEEAIRYVVLHELCHLKYMNHSADFWKLVETYMPDYKEVKKELKQ